MEFRKIVVSRVLSLQYSILLAEKGNKQVKSWNNLRINIIIIMIIIYFIIILLLISISGADPRFFLGGGALVSCSASTPINHIVFFFFCRIPVVLENRRSSQGGGGVRTRCTLPLDPPLYLKKKVDEVSSISEKRL